MGSRVKYLHTARVPIWFIFDGALTCCLYIRWWQQVCLHAISLISLLRARRAKPAKPAGRVCFQIYLTFAYVYFRSATPRRRVTPAYIQVYGLCELLIHQGHATHTRTRALRPGVKGRLVLTFAIKFWEFENDFLSERKSDTPPIQTVHLQFKHIWDIRLSCTSVRPVSASC